MAYNTPYIPKPNTGTLWPNERKATQNHPDIRGDLNLDVKFIMDMIQKYPNSDAVKVSISGWAKTINGKDCVSLQASAPYVKPVDAPAKSVYDEDVPF